MKTLFATLMFFPVMAFADISALQGNYIAANLGCATPHSSNYQLTVTQSIFDFDATENSVTRSVTVNAVGKGEVIFNCTVNYQGPMSEVDGAFYGTLQRVSYTCAPLNDRDSLGIVSRFIDPYFIETDVITPISVSVNGAELKIKQLAPPAKELRGCGLEYPEFTYQKQ